jgi:hypothetical protein
VESPVLIAKALGEGDFNPPLPRLPLPVLCAWPVRLFADRKEISYHAVFNKRSALARYTFVVAGTAMRGELYGGVIIKR